MLHPEWMLFFKKVWCFLEIDAEWIECGVWRGGVEEAEGR